MAPHVLPRSKQLGVEDIVADAALYTAKPREMLGAHTPLIPSGAATLHEAKEAIFKVPPDERMAIDDADSEQAVSSNDAGGRQRWLIMRREQASRRAHRTVSKQSGRDTENDYPQFHKAKSREFACAEDALNAGRPWPAMFTDGQRRDLTADAVKKDANRGKPSAKTPVPQMVYRLAGVLAWSIGTIRAVAKKLGGVLLATNELDATRLPAQEVLVLSKGPSKRERGVTFLKRPDVLAASFFVKPPERLAAVVMIMT